MNENVMLEQNKDIKVPEITIRDLMCSGAHYGHKVSRWNPKMAPYIYCKKNGVHIIDLGRTLFLLKKALRFIVEVARKNGTILFVGTRSQFSESVAEFAKECGHYYVNYRWVGGMLTNWKTVSSSIRLMKDIKKNLDDEDYIASITKKEGIKLAKKYKKLEDSLAGIAEMGKIPSAIIVLDTIKEFTAIKEAKVLSIPVIAIVDTNSDPDAIDYPIPANDDSVNTITLLCSLFCQSALIGKKDLIESNANKESLSANRKAFTAKTEDKLSSSADSSKTNTEIKADKDSEKASESKVSDSTVTDKK